MVGLAVVEAAVVEAAVEGVRERAWGVPVLVVSAVVAAAAAR